MFRIFALGLLIYAVWKLLSGFFTPSKTNHIEPNAQNHNPSDRNKDDDGFTPFEEVE